VATIALAVIIVACTSDDGVSTSGPTTRPAGETTTSDGGAQLAEGIDPTQDFEAQADDFVNVNDMTKVRGFFVDNRLGYLDEAIAVAESPTGGVYPPGTIIQLVPQEAMVKRGAGYSPEFADWEFFVLSPTPEGTEIVSRGHTEVMNRFGGSCATCHAKADVEFDFVCEQDHGCDPLPIGDDMFGALQQGDPRPRSSEGESDS
jgi:hypothetical protein